MLVKCEICQGTGKVRCDCSLAHDSEFSRPSQDGKADSCSSGISERTGVSLDEKNGAAGSEECSECGGSGSVMCLGCMGTGYVDMPCFA